VSSSGRLGGRGVFTGRGAKEGGRQGRGRVRAYKSNVASRLRGSKVMDLARGGGKVVGRCGVN